MRRSRLAGDDRGRQGEAEGRLSRELAELTQGRGGRPVARPLSTVDLRTWGVAAELALFLYAIYLALAFGLRSLLQWMATGSTGFKGSGVVPARRNEPPYLRSTHGEAYERYAASIGRFVPAIGRLRSSPAAVGLDRGQSVLAPKYSALRGV